MEKLLIEGGYRLEGDVEISGAKNAVVAIIPATVLAKGVCVLENIPNISDVTALFHILRELGAKVRMLDKRTVEIDTTNMGEPVIPYELTRTMRASYYFLGSLLGRCGRASVSMPGGCQFGVRPINLHIMGFEAMGAQVSIDGGMINADAPNLSGAGIYFDQVSVGATVNIMLAAVKAKGLTVIENAAREPHIVDLANFLNSMGADVRGAGTDVIKIYGVDVLHGSTYSIIPDQIEAGTYLAAAATAGGDVTIRNVIPKHLESITNKLEAAGAELIEGDDWVRIKRDPAVPLKGINVKTMPHPGFPTDMQPQITAMLTQAEGTSIVTEGVWDNRFRYVDELIRLGANIQVDGKVAVVIGPSRLKGAPVKATDLRGGAAAVIAALAAEGTTEVEEIGHIMRGYDNIVGKLQALGAHIECRTYPDGEMPKAL